MKRTHFVLIAFGVGLLVAPIWAQEEPEPITLDSPDGLKQGVRLAERFPDLTRELPPDPIKIIRVPQAIRGPMDGSRLSIGGPIRRQAGGNLMTAKQQADRQIHRLIRRLD